MLGCSLKTLYNKLNSYARDGRARPCTDYFELAELAVGGRRARLDTRHPSGIVFHMPDLSPKQLEVLAFIRRFMESGGLPPTRGEIAEGLRLKNRQGIDQHLRALAAKGAIELIPGISRGIRLVGSPARRDCRCWGGSRRARRSSPHPTSRIT